MQNTGFLAAPPRETDWIAGANTGITYERMNHLGDWTVFLPFGERQNGVYMDSKACVTYSALNCVEAQIRAHIAYQRIPPKTYKWLIDSGFMGPGFNFNVSDRFTAKMSGTTQAGNYFVNVWDSIRKDGILPDFLWSYPNDQREPVFDWDDYYRDIPGMYKNQAKEFLDYFDVKYEWLAVDKEVFLLHLNQAPIQIATPTCTGWNTAKPVAKCSDSPNHATMLYRLDKNYFDFDSYNPFQKELAPDYPIYYAIKGVVTPKETFRNPITDTWHNVVLS